MPVLDDLIQPTRQHSECHDARTRIHLYRGEEGLPGPSHPSPSQTTNHTGVCHPNIPYHLIANLFISVYIYIRAWYDIRIGKSKAAQELHMMQTTNVELE